MQAIQKVRKQFTSERRFIDCNSALEAHLNLPDVETTLQGQQLVRPKAEVRIWD